MDRAYARGDHEIARKLARDLAQSPDADAAKRAAALLSQTEPDAFIYGVSLLGLGLVAYLVYNYIL